MNAITCDETGLVKLVTLKDNVVKSVLGFQGDRSVNFLRYAGPLNDREMHVACAVSNGIVELWRPSDSVIVSDFNAGGGMVGFDVFYDNDDVRRVITCTESGEVRVGRFTDVPELLDSDAESDDGDVEEFVDATFSAGENICRMKLEPTHHASFACGGREHLLRVWDIENQQVLFRARNVPHDFLDMRVPVWIRDLQFIPSSTTKIVTGTAHYQMRMYDIKAQKRAVIDMKLGEEPIISLSCDPDGHRVVCGSGGGDMYSVDLRKTSSVVHTFKGIGGSVRCVHHHPTLPLVASVGLDRHLRVYHTKTRKLVNKVYLKQRLNGVLLSSAVPARSSADNNNSGDGDESDEDMWKMLGPARKKVKRRRSSTD